MTFSPAESSIDDFLPTTRMEALTDGVFAIVMTLLILEFKVPADLSTGLLELGPSFLSYALSFVMLGVYWVGHNVMFSYIIRTDRVLLWINILFLMGISLLPFSTALLNAHNAEHLPYFVYGGNMILIGLLNYWYWYYATMHHRLTEHSLETSIIRTVKLRILLPPVLSAFAIALSLVSMRASLLLYFVLPFIILQPTRRDRLWKAKAIPHNH